MQHRNNEKAQGSMSSPTSQQKLTVMSALHNLSYHPTRSVDKNGKRFNYVLPSTSSGAERRKYISLKAEEEQDGATLKQ
jgi:hypothetical protein